jgi:hypothetical protein
MDNEVKSGLVRLAIAIENIGAIITIGLQIYGVD